MKLTAGFRNAWQRFVPATKQDVERILMKVSEVAAFVSSVDAAVGAMGVEVEKIGTEVQALKDSLADVEIPAEAKAALDSLSSRVTTVTDALKKVDDIIPDNPTPTP